MENLKTQHETLLKEFVELSRDENVKKFISLQEQLSSLENQMKEEMKATKQLDEFFSYKIEWWDLRWTLIRPSISVRYNYDLTKIKERWFDVSEFVEEKLNSTQLGKADKKTLKDIQNYLTTEWLYEEVLWFRAKNL